MTESDPLLRLFVYGTRLPGEAHHWRIRRYVRSARPGRIDGVLLDLGPYPALVAGDGIVRGMVLDLEPHGLCIADRIEGYDPTCHRGEYLRKEVSVRLELLTDDGGESDDVTAWVYELAEPERLGQCPILAVGTEEGRSVHAWGRLTIDVDGPADTD